MNMYGVALNTDYKILPDQPLTREEAFRMINAAFVAGGDNPEHAPFTSLPDTPFAGGSVI